MKLNKKTLTLLFIVIGIGTIALTGFMFRREVQEQYWLWKIKEGTGKERERAGTYLSKLGSFNVIKEIVPIAAESLKNQSWYVSGRSGIFSPPQDIHLEIIENDPNKYLDPLLTIKICKSVKNRESVKSTEILEDLLLSDSPEVKALSAFILFEKDSEINPHLPPNKILIEVE